MFNVFGGADYGSPTTHSQHKKIGLRVKQLTLSFLFSFLFNKYNTGNQECNSETAEYKAQKQGQVFEEITGKAYADNIFAKISDSFSSKFPSFFVEKMAHKQLPSLKSVGERQYGELRS